MKLKPPTYHIKRAMFELHPSTTERYMENFMKAKGIEAIALELHENTLIGHVERIMESTEKHIRT